MAEQHLVPINARSVTVVFTDAADGDFRVLDPDSGLEDRRRVINDRPWSWIRQVHGDRVLAVSTPGQHAGVEADGLVTSATGCPIAVTTADCAPVVLVADDGVAVVHAGWRGLAAGIIETGAEKLLAGGARPVVALLGPCIGPDAYQFGRSELDQLIDRLGRSVESTTATGDLALDVPAAVAAACRRAGFPPPERPACTSDRRWFSHRTRADRGRQTAVAWIDDGG